MSKKCGLAFFDTLAIALKISSDANRNYVDVYDLDALKPLPHIGVFKKHSVNSAPPLNT